MLRATVSELELELARYKDCEPNHTQTLVVDEDGAEMTPSATEEDAEAANAPALPVPKPVPTLLPLPAPEPEPASAPEPEPAPPPEAALLADARSLAAAALHAAEEMQAQVRALELTPEPEPQSTPEPAPEPAPAPVPSPSVAALTQEAFQITVRRGSRGLGLRVNDLNIITELTAGGQAAQEGQLAVGDLVVAVDGVPMYDVAKGIRPLTEVLSNMPVKDDYRFEHTAYKSPAQQARGGRGGACLNVSLQSRTVRQSSNAEKSGCGNSRAFWGGGEHTAQSHPSEQCSVPSPHPPADST